MAARPQPRSCDTFVYVAGLGGPACTLFGKNSDRPSEEEHEVVYFPAQVYEKGARVRCTYVEVDQASSTCAVVLSRPRWLWGCEMGANEYCVVGGNEAVSSLLSRELGGARRLLGMDLLRLALERGRTAQEASQVCAALLETYGQGGGCAEDDDDWTYENSFLFADSLEAYVLETAGVRHWACERVLPGKHRNISNSLSIRSDICTHSKGLRELCAARGWWDGQQVFDWKAALEAGGQAHANLGVCGREKAGRDHMLALADALNASRLRADDAASWVRVMASVLRDETSGICFRDTHGFNSTGSQISWLPSIGSLALPSHFFTCSSDPLTAAYKRFAFPREGSQVEFGLAADHGSLELWRRWRAVALGGGLAQVVGVEAAARVRQGMEALEDAAVCALTEGTSGSPGELAAAVRAELEILSAVTSERGHFEST